MKRFVLFSFFIINNLNAATPPPATPVNRNMPPPRGLSRVNVPGAGPVVSRQTITPRTALRTTARPGRPANRNIAPPTGLSQVNVPGVGQVVPTQSVSNIAEFAAEQQAFAQQIAREQRSSGNPAWSIPTTRKAPVASATPLPATPNAAPAPMSSPARARIPVAATGHSMIDVINTTGNELELFIQDGAGGRHQKTLTAGTILTSMQIPNTAQSAYVQNTNTCAPISIINGLKGIVINPDSTGLKNYEITPLIPTYENYVLVYNQSPFQQLMVLEIALPSSGLIGYLPGFLGGTHTVKITKQLAPQETGLIEIPKFTTHIDNHYTPTVITPTSVTLSIPSSIDENTYTINTNEHDSFVITHNNNLIAST